MSQKNETPVLVLSLLITVGLIAGGLWWFTKKSGFDLGKPTGSQSENSAYDNGKMPQSSSEKPSGSTFASVQNVPTGLFT
jgi:phosphate transport system substrate-binding protein